MWTYTATDTSVAKGVAKDLKRMVTLKYSSSRQFQNNLKRIQFAEQCNEGPTVYLWLWQQVSHSIRLDTS